MGKDLRLIDLIEKSQAANPRADLKLIRRAYRFAAKVHKGQQRLSGEPFLAHPVAVAHILADLGLDASVIAAGLLHDTIDDTLTTLDEVRSIFGEEVASLVDGVTMFGTHSGNDTRIFLIKLADRAHNMRTLSHLPFEKQMVTAEETLNIFVPLAHRLGVDWIKDELEELALRSLYPELVAQEERSWFHTFCFFVPRELREPWLGCLREDRARMVMKKCSRTAIEWATITQFVFLIIHWILDKVMETITPFKNR